MGRAEDGRVLLLVTSVLFQHAEESPWSFFKVTSI